MKQCLAYGVMLILAACGGGGDSGSSSQLQSVRTPAEPFSITPTNLIGVDAYHMTYSQTPNSGMSSFDGQSAHTSTTSATVFNGNATVLAQSSTDYFLQSPYMPLGAEGTTAAEAYELVFDSVTPLPAVLTVGATGPLASGTYYLPGTNTAIGTLSVSYAVAGYNSTLVKLSIATTGMLNGAAIAQTVSYTVDASGLVHLNAFQVTLAGSNLFFGLPAP